MFQLHSLIIRAFPERIIIILSGNAFHLPHAIILKPEDAIITKNLW